MGVWLTIAGFYRKAGLLGDAQKACAEAQKIVQDLESDVAGDASGNLSTKQAGWGEKKSVEELHADVWAEVSGCVGSGAWGYMLTQSTERKPIHRSREAIPGSLRL